jgi:hypothetical protein
MLRLLGTALYVGYTPGIEFAPSWLDLGSRGVERAKGSGETGKLGRGGEFPPLCQAYGGNLTVLDSFNLIYPVSRDPPRERRARSSILGEISDQQ